MTKPKGSQSHHHWQPALTTDPVPSSFLTSLYLGHLEAYQRAREVVEECAESPLTFALLCGHSPE